MNKIDFIKIIGKLKEDAKEELPSFPEAFYMSYSFIYVAIYEDGSFETSCSTTILNNAIECFMLVSGFNNYGACWYILYYIDGDGVPHKDAYIDELWTISIDYLGSGDKRSYDMSLRFDEMNITSSEWKDPKSSEKALRDIVGRYLAIRHCKTIEEARLCIEVIGLKKELQNQRNRTAYINAYLSEETNRYKKLLDDIKALIGKE